MTLKEVEDEYSNSFNHIVSIDFDINNLQKKVRLNVSWNSFLLKKLDANLSGKNRSQYLARLVIKDLNIY